MRESALYSNKSNKNFNRRRTKRRRSNKTISRNVDSSTNNLLNDSKLKTGDPETVMKFNVGGRTFQTLTSTLIPRPGTRLSWLAYSKRGIFFNNDFEYRDGVYYFDRDPDFFNYVLQYYRTGELHMPPYACSAFLMEEMRFWGISDSQIQPCCQSNFKAFHEADKVLFEMTKKVEKAMESREENFLYNLHADRLNPIENFRWKLRTSFDDIYRMSTAGLFYTIISMVFTILVVVVASCMTLIGFRVPYKHVRRHSKTHTLFTTSPNGYLIGVDVLCLIYFVTEYCLRVFAARSYNEVLKSFLCANDLFCNVFSVFTYFIWTAAKPMSMQFEALFYVPRVLRILRLFRHIRSLEVLTLTMKTCTSELTLFSLFCVIGVVISGTVVYLAEMVGESPSNQMKNMFDAFYFAVISWTTVGYGDFVPKSGIGMFLTAIVCWLAAVTILMPIPLMANTFIYFYRHFKQTMIRANAQSRLRMKRILERFLLNDPELLYISSGSSISAVSA